MKKNNFDCWALLCLAVLSGFALGWIVLPTSGIAAAASAGFFLTASGEDRSDAKWSLIIFAAQFAAGIVGWLIL